MSLFDLVIIAVLALFAGIGALRGTMRELTSLAVWLLAILGGWLFADAVGTWFEGIADHELRRLVAFLSIVLSLLALLTLAVFVLRIFLPRPSPDLKGRIIGAVLGSVRGAFVVLVLVLLAGLTSLPKRSDWQDSMLVKVFRPAAEQVLDWLPAPVARQFRYS
jgi:membrane protein required for colicin V production